MIIKSNVPSHPIMVGDKIHKFEIGDRVRIKFHPVKYKSFPYSGAAMIGIIEGINNDSFIVSNNTLSKTVKFDEVYKMRVVDESETLDTVPYINEKEREFWNTHIITKDGIKRKPINNTK